LARVLEFIENVLAQLESADWAAAAVAVAVHVANVAVRAHAWRNIIAAAYPADRVGRRRIFSAYAAGAGVNALSPWRGGELLRLSLARRAVAGSTYPGLVSTLGVETVFNSLAAGALFGFAVAQGAFPNPDRRVAVALLAAGIAGVATVAFLARARRLSKSFGTGFRVFRDPAGYLRDVAAWQALDWMLRLVTIYWFMRAFGIEGGIEAVLLVQGAQSASALIPLAPARIGAKQAVLAYALGSQVSGASLLAFLAGSEVPLAGTNAVLGVGALMVALGTLRWREVLAPRFAPAEP
jgi:uncharacterized membrane protein YbhN (UPF0104 family)